MEDHGCCMAYSTAGLTEERDWDIYLCCHLGTELTVGYNETYFSMTNALSIIYLRIRVYDLSNSLSLYCHLIEF